MRFEEDRIAQLEADMAALHRNLENYHNRLEGAIEQRDARLFQFANSWLSSLMPMAVAVFAVYLVNDWWDLSGLIGGAASAAVWLIVWLGMAMLIGSSLEKDENSMNKLPEWWAINDTRHYDE